MTTDRTTKILLVLIALGLWGVLLRLLFAPVPAQAQGARKPQYEFWTTQNTLGQDFSIKEDRFQAALLQK